VAFKIFQERLGTFQEAFQPFQGRSKGMLWNIIRRGEIL